MFPKFGKFHNNILKNSNRVLKNFGLANRKNDLDFDGVKNKFDCQPRNTMRQDFNAVGYGGVQNKLVNWKNNLLLRRDKIKYGFYEGQSLIDREKREIKNGLLLQTHKYNEIELSKLPENYHIKAVELGIKSIATTSRKYPSILPYKKFNERFLYYRPETKEVADELIEEYKKGYNHQKIGKLFSYSDKEIEDFNKHMQKLDTYNKVRNVNLSSTHGYEDSDNDGIINADDCQPNNPNEQGVFHKRRRIYPIHHYSNKQISDDEEGREREPPWALIRKRIREKQLVEELNNDRIERINIFARDILKKKKTGLTDSDGDGVSDAYDCQPNNPKEQDVFLSKSKNKDKFSMYTYGRGNVLIGTQYKNVDFNKQQNIKSISETLAHEEIHNYLNQEHDADTSTKLDNISANTGFVHYPTRVELMPSKYPAKLSGYKGKIRRDKYIYRQGQPYEDNDNDGVINAEDCESNNPDKQGEVHDDLYKKILEQREKRQREIREASENIKASEPKQVAYEALRISADRARAEREQHLQETAAFTHDVKKMLANKPIAIDLRNRKIITIDENKAGEIAHELDKEVGNFMIKDNARAILAYKLYGKQEWDLTKEEQTHINYLIRQNVR